MTFKRKTQLREAPSQSKHESAKWKLEEAYYHLKDIETKDGGVTREFQFEVSAIITPARSAHMFLWEQNEKAYAAWKDSLDQASRDILDIATDARNLEVHHQGAAMTPGLTFTWIPTPGTYRHGFHVPIRGVDHVVPVAGVLKRYLGLLKAALTKIK